MAFAKEKIIFRGAKLRNGTWKIEESGTVHRLKFICDMSSTVAEALGIHDHFYEAETDDLNEFSGELKMSGSLVAESFRLEPNGMTQHTIELLATTVEWEAYNKAGKDDDDSDEAGLKLSISTGEGFAVVEQYARVAGSADAVLKLTLAGNKQMPLVPTEEEAEPKSAPLASAAEVKRAAKVNLAASAAAARAAKGVQ